MTSKPDPDFVRRYDRGMLRAMFQSLFWAAIAHKRKKSKFSQQQIADALGVHKSGISRGFSVPPNWTIDKMADIASALDLDLVVEARDRSDGTQITPYGAIPNRPPVVTRAVPPSPPPPQLAQATGARQIGDGASLQAEAA